MGFFMKWLFCPLIAFWMTTLSFSAIAFSTNKITRNISTNSRVIIQNYLTYDISPCRSKAAPAVDPRTPELGKVSVSIVQRKFNNGPCGPNFDYNALQVIYESGSVAGIDRFILYVSNGHGFTPVPVEIRVGSGLKAPPEKRVSAPKKPLANATRSPANASSTFIGTYVNNFGNEIAVNNEFVHFTGMWSGQKVKNKTFTVVQNSSGRLLWASYVCEGDSVSFVCTHQKTKEQRLYRRVK